jgi:hypothetical protein
LKRYRKAPNWQPKSFGPSAGLAHPVHRSEDCCEESNSWPEISSVSLALVPLHPRGTRCDGVVVPLESQRLLAEHVGLEAPPSLDLEVVERTAVGTKPMRYAWGEIHERAGLEFLGRIPDLDYATALERDVAVAPSGLALVPTCR